MTQRTLLVLHSTHTVIGGVESRQYHLAKLLATRGWRVVFGLTRGQRFHDPSTFRAMFPDVETMALDGRTGTRDGRMLAIEKAIRRVRPAVVLPGALLDAFEVIRALKSRGTSVRLVYGLPGIHVGTLCFLNRYSPVIDQGFGVSRLIVDLLERVVSIPHDRVHYVPSGVAPASQMPARKPGVPIRLGYVGRFDADKRVLDLIDLCKELDRVGVDYRLVAVGHGLLEKTLRAETEPWLKRGVLRIVKPMPPLLLYQQVYPDLDACLLFSAFEGMPNALLEAMTHGVVPITSDFAGRKAEDLIREEETGLVFPVGDLAEAARQVSRLATDVELHERLSRTARQAVRMEHNLDAMGDAFHRLLEQALELPPRSGGVRPLDHDESSRLRRFLGPSEAERVRRLFRYRFPHPDPGEWPLIESYQGPEVTEVARLTEEGIRIVDSTSNPREAARTLIPFIGERVQTALPEEGV